MSEDTSRGRGKMSQPAELKLGDCWNY